MRWVVVDVIITTYVATAPLNDNVNKVIQEYTKTIAFTYYNLTLR